MNIRERITYHVFRRFQRAEDGKRWDAQYQQWISEGYSRQVQCEMMVRFVLGFILRLGLPASCSGCITSYIDRPFGISPEMYRFYRRRYERQYLDPWDPDHIHVRLMIRFSPCLIPESRRRSVFSRYKVWQAQVSDSPLSTLHALVTYFESHNVDPQWYRNVKNTVEFKIWVRGMIEKPFHLRRYGQWALKDFPDPKYKDPVRYELAASIMEQLVDVFNWRTERGIRRDYIQTGWETMLGRRWDLEYPPPQLESAPRWTKRVPLSPIPLVISGDYSGEGQSYDQVLAMYNGIDKPNEHFLKRRFIVEGNCMQFV